MDDDPFEIPIGSILACQLSTPIDQVTISEICEIAIKHLDFLTKSLQQLFKEIQL